MELIVKEYRKKLVPVTVIIKSFARNWVKYERGSKVEKIWQKRRCYVCRGKFNPGDNITLAMTDRGSKIICPKCSDEIVWDESLEVRKT